MALQFDKKKMFHEAVLERKPSLLSRRMAKRERRRIGVGALLLWSVFVGTLFYSLYFAPWLLVRETTLLGESVVPREILNSFLEENLSGKTWLFFSRRQQSVLSPGKIERAWLERFPKFESVQVERRFPDKLVVSFREQPYLVRWCSGGPCFHLREGKAVSESYVHEEYYSPYVFTIIDRSARPVVLGETLDVLDYEYAVQLLADSFFSSIGISFEPTFETPSLSAHEIRLKTSEGWEVFFNTRTFSANTLDILKRTLLDKVSGEKRPLLLSIDLRTEGKVFVAYRRAPTDADDVKQSGGEAPKKEE